RVILPAIRNPPVVDKRVTEKPALMSSLQTFLESSLFTMAVIIFITAVPLSAGPHGLFGQWLRPAHKIWACFFHYSTQVFKLPEKQPQFLPLLLPPLILPGLTAAVISDLLAQPADAALAEEDPEAQKTRQNGQLLAKRRN